MTKQEITDGNIIIADFMEVKISTKEEYAKMISCPTEEIINMPEQNVYYHSSWDWLMPVVEKIESLDLRKNGYDFPKVKFMGDYIEIFWYANYRGTSYYWKDWMDCAGTFHKHINQCESKILAIFSAIVEFIKWYNNNIKNI